MSRSKIADEEECLREQRFVIGCGRRASGAYTEVGEDGIEEGEREPSLAELVWSRFVEALEGFVESFGGVAMPPFDVMCLKSWGEVAAKREY